MTQNPIGYTSPGEIERLRKGGTAVVQPEASDVSTEPVTLGHAAHRLSSETAAGGDMVLVPREPTREMLNAIDIGNWPGSADKATAIYRAMLAAAPSSALPAQGVGVKAEGEDYARLAVCDYGGVAGFVVGRGLVKHPEVTAFFEAFDNRMTARWPLGPEGHEAALDAADKFLWVQARRIRAALLPAQAPAETGEAVAWGLFVNGRLQEAAKMREELDDDWAPHIEVRPLYASPPAPNAQPETASVPAPAAGVEEAAR